MSPTDLFVHIDETLNLPSLEAIEQDIQHGKGVASACHRPDNLHLIQVIYDSDETRMAEIVQGVRHHGLHAQAIGL
jgi:hypothetical protein